MSDTAGGFTAKLDLISLTLVGQGHRVAQLFEDACDAVFTMDVKAARAVVDADDEIDKVDIEIECRTVALLGEVASRAEPVSEGELRRMLTIVKVNNELERAADSATTIAAQTPMLAEIGEALPDTLRVLTNSVAGILRDVTRSIERGDPRLAKAVLDAEDTVEAFKSQLLRDAERLIAVGEISVDYAFAVHELANQCERIADHATNIAEQVIYVKTGAIVRHTDAGWIELPRSD